MGANDMSDQPEIISQPTEQIQVEEGEPIAISVRVHPAECNSLRVDWFKGSQPLSASSRYFASLDRGYASLEFLYTNFEDSGEYFCIAVTDQGQVKSSGCVVKVVAEVDSKTDSRMPDKPPMESETMMNGTQQFSAPLQKPTILKPLRRQINLRENDKAHFDTLIEPKNDPSLVVEWFKNGQPLTTGCRFSSTLDRGVSVLEINYCYPDDSGEYYLIARNSAGEVQSNVAQLTCKQEASIITDSTLSKESVSYLARLDSWSSSGTAAAARSYEDELPSAPIFESSLAPVSIVEGSPVRLLVKAKGVPHPRVQWYINGDILASSGGGGRWRIYADGGISYLEFTRCGPPGTYEVKVVAKNNLGETSSNTTMKIEPLPDYRPDLKHVVPENTMKKLIQLKKVGCTPELETALRKPKAKASLLGKLERRQSLTSSEAEAAKDMYSHVQASLKPRRSITSIQSALEGKEIHSTAQVTVPTPIAQPLKPPLPKESTVLMNEMFKQQESSNVEAEFTIEL